MTITFVVPDAPAIAGFSFRSIRGIEDANALHAVRAGSMAHDEVDPLSTLEGILSREDLHASLAKAVVDSQQDRWLVAQIDEHVVGYSRIACWPERDGTWVYLTLGWVLPEWRGRGIGTAMLHWTEDHIRHLAAAEHPTEKIEFAANASSTEKEATALLLHEGYRAGYTVLEIGLDASMSIPPLTALPAGIEVRPVARDHYSPIGSSVHEAYQHEYDAGRFDESSDPAEFVTELSDPKHDPTLWQIAWDGNQIAGQVLSVIENGRAEVFEVSVRPAWRRHGLARGLLLRALHSLCARGIGVVRLHTRADFRTHARDLYHSVGFHVLKEFPRYCKPLGS